MVNVYIYERTAGLNYVGREAFIGESNLQCEWREAERVEDRCKLGRAVKSTRLIKASRRRMRRYLSANEMNQAFYGHAKALQFHEMTWTNFSGECQGICSSEFFFMAARVESFRL